jgi:hypothetical protein
MSDNHDLLNDKDVCSFEEHEAENVCSNKDAVACGDCVLIITEIGGFTGFYEWSSVYLPPICHRNFKNYH